MAHIAISIGDQLFAAEDGEPFGAVRQVRPHELVVDIEGSGDTTVPASAVLRVHDGKVVVDVAQLSLELQHAIARAHAREGL